MALGWPSALRPAVSPRVWGVGHLHRGSQTLPGRSVWLSMCSLQPAMHGNTGAELKRPKKHRWRWQTAQQMGAGGPRGGDEYDIFETSDCTSIYMVEVGSWAAVHFVGMLRKQKELFS